jgi:c-di-GMP-binding flagellar brake protein YcgR
MTFDTSYEPPAPIFCNFECLGGLSLTVRLRVQSSMSSSSLEKALQAKQRGWQRRHERYRTDFSLKGTVLRENGYQELRGRCGDIGRGGMGAVFTAELAKGEVVSLEFRLSEESNPLAVRSIVRYRRGFLHGLEFLGLTDEQQTQIRDFCAELAPSA